MDISAEEFVDRLLTGEAHEEPSDEGKADDLEMQLPKWFDEKKYNQGRRFYADFCFMFLGSMVAGLVSVFSIPSIINLLVGTRRSNSEYTAYRRYFSTQLHTLMWFEHELKPGSLSWKSLYTVRRRHVQAGTSARMKGTGTVSQRDVCLTLFGFIGFSILKPDKFSITQVKEGDWEAYNHFWAVVAHMIGLKDKYNICRGSVEQTRQICKVLLDRVYTPCLENVPEYFEHSSHVMLNGLSNLVSALEPTSVIFTVKYLADVPGYIYTEEDRCNIQKKIKYALKLKGLPEDAGIDASELIEKCCLKSSSKREPNILYLRDFETVDSSPAYKKMSTVAKYKLAFNNIVFSLYMTYYGRMFFNFYYYYITFMNKYMPYLAIWKFGLKNALVNAFNEDPVDNTVPLPNSEYRKSQPEPWYKVLYGILW